MSLRRPKYHGLCLLVTDRLWRIGIARRVDGTWQDLDARKVFHPDLFKSRLQEYGLVVDSVDMGDDGILSLSTQFRGHASKEAKRILAVLNSFYANYHCDHIRWMWNIRQYD